MIGKSLLTALYCAAAAVAAAAPLKIGWASGPIHDGKTHTQIFGQHYLRWDREGTLDPLTASCLVIDNGEDQLIFLSVDTSNFGYGNPFGQYVMKKLAETAPDLPQDKIIAGATHTHTGGDMAGASVPKYLQKNVTRHAFTDGAIQAIADIVKQAWDNRKPGKIAYGFSYAVVGHQRRAVYFEDRSKRPNATANAMLIHGHAVMYGRTDVDDFSHHETGADATVNFLFTFDMEDKLTGAIVNIPCPSQCSEHMWALSADYWADVRANLRSRYGENLYVLPQCAAAGDLSPHLRSYQSASSRKWRLKYGREDKYMEEFNRRDIAERVGWAFDDAYSWAKNELFADLPIQNRRIELQLPKFKPTEADVENAQKVVKLLDGVDKQDAGQAATPEERKELQKKQASLRIARNVLKKAAEYDPKDTIDTFINVARLGDVAFFSNPFELYMDYMHRLQARSPFEQTFVIQLSMPGRGYYLGTERSKANRGYGNVAANSTVGPEGGQLMIETALKALKDMKNTGEPKK